MILHRACGYSSSDFQYIDAPMPNGATHELRFRIHHNVVEGQTQRKNNQCAIRLTKNKDSWKEWKIWGLMSHRTVRIGEPHLGSNLSTIKISNPKITAVR